MNEADQLYPICNIYHIKKKQLKEYVPPQTDKNKILCIDFKRIDTWEVYAEIVEKALEFPRPIKGSPNRFLDWITDLSWYEYERYDLFFFNFKHLACKNLIDANEIYCEFEETILPFWRYEVIHTVVDGKPKDFNVYFVE